MSLNNYSPHSKERVLILGTGCSLSEEIAKGLLSKGVKVAVYDTQYNLNFDVELENSDNLLIIKDSIENHENHSDLFENTSSVIYLDILPDIYTEKLSSDSLVNKYFNNFISIFRHASDSGVKNFLTPFISKKEYGDYKFGDKNNLGAFYFNVVNSAIEKIKNINIKNMQFFPISIPLQAGAHGKNWKISPLNKMLLEILVDDKIKANLSLEQKSNSPTYLHGFSIAKQLLKFQVELFDSSKDNTKLEKIEGRKLNFSELEKILSSELKQDGHGINDNKFHLKNDANDEDYLRWIVHEVGHAIKIEDININNLANFYKLYNDLNSKRISYYPPSFGLMWKSFSPHAREITKTAGEHKKIIAMIIAYNCEKMIEKAYNKIPQYLVDDIIVMDDGSTDRTYEIAKSRGMKVFKNKKNLGYGGNVRAGLKQAFSMGADYVVEIHGDGAQFDPVSIKYAIPYIQSGKDLVLGSRFQNPRQALENGMPLIRFIANHFLSFFDRWILKLPLTEFHTGFRIYSKNLYDNVPLEANSNNYLFSFQIIAQAAYFKMNVAEVPVEADYNSEHTSHSIRGAAVYAISTFNELRKFLMAKNLGMYSKSYPKLSESKNKSLEHPTSL